MAKQKGRLMLVKIGDGASTEAFTTLCGLTAKDLTINNSEVDVTTADCVTPGGVMWTEVQSGVKRISVSGTGYFKDETSEARMNTVAMAAEPFANFEIVVPELGTFAGSFFMSDLKFGGPVQDGVTYDISLASSGAVTFTAA